MSSSQSRHFATGRFRPVSLQYFNLYAKHLGMLTGDGYNRSRETLAKIYRYRNAYELQNCLLEWAEAGPFDDAIPLSDVNTEVVRGAINERNTRAMQIILDANKSRYDNGAPRPTLLQLHMLGLFSTPKVHLQGFRDLEIIKKSSTERREERARYETSSL